MARKAAAPALLALLIAIGLHSPGAASAAGSPCPGANQPAASLTLDRLETAVFCLVNRRRNEAGRSWLVPNPILHRAARAYASSMLAGHFFSHHGDFGGRRTGSTVIGRLREMGYIRHGDVWVVGENLYWWTADRSTAAATVEAWMESAIHRKYLLNPRFEELGVAAQRGIPYDPTQTEGITIAAEFGFRRSQ